MPWSDWERAGLTLPAKRPGGGLRRTGTSGRTHDRPFDLPDLPPALSTLPWVLPDLLRAAQEGGAHGPDDLGGAGGRGGDPATTVGGVGLARPNAGHGRRHHPMTCTAFFTLVEADLRLRHVPFDHRCTAGPGVLIYLRGRTAAAAMDRGRTPWRDSSAARPLPRRRDARTAI